MDNLVVHRDICESIVEDQLVNIIIYEIMLGFCGSPLDHLWRKVGSLTTFGSLRTTTILTPGLHDADLEANK